MPSPNTKNDTLHLILGVITFVILVIGAWFLAFELIPILATGNPSILAAIITGTLVAVGAIYVKHIEHKHSVEAQFRDAKVQMYNDFIELFDSFSEGGGPEDAVSELKKWRRQLLFWGGPKVIKTSFQLQNTAENLDTVEGMGNSVEIIGDLILAMRQDLGLSNRGIVEGVSSGISQATVVGARYKLRHADIFLQCLRENPSMLSKEFSAVYRLSNSSPLKPES